MSKCQKIKMLTGNHVKFQIAQHVFSAHGLDIEQLNVDVPEIQSMDCIEVAKYAALSGARQYGGPVFKSDVAWHIEALNGFPGALIKYAAKLIDADGWLRLMSGYSSRKILIRECLACAWEDGRTIHFTHEIDARFSDVPAGDNGVEIDKVVIIGDSDRTTAELMSDEQLTRWLGNQSAYNDLALFLKQEMSA